MDAMFLIATAATIAVLALSARLTTMCDQTYYREVRGDDETLLVIRALGETVRTSDAAAPFVYPHWMTAASRRPMTGHVVTVTQVIGQPAAVRQAMSAGARVVLVPWEHDSGCQPIPWTSTSPWIHGGTEGFVAARLRTRGEWAGDLPTFDVRDAWREPYTSDRAVAALGGLAEGRSVMTPVEYGRFYSLLPNEAEWRRGANSWVRRVVAWAETNSELAKKEPAATMILVMRRAAKGAGG